MQRTAINTGQTTKPSVMKYIFVAVLVIPFLAFQCNKDRNDHKDWLEGKVVRISCASYVVQVLNNDAIGEDGWKDMFDNNKEYDNAINASNKCEIPESITAGTVIRFKIEGPYNKPCAACFMYDAPPNVAYDITNVSVVQ